MSKKNDDAKPTHDKGSRQRKEVASKPPQGENAVKPKYPDHMSIDKPKKGKPRD